MADHDSTSDSSGDEDYAPEGGSDSEEACRSASEEEEVKRCAAASEGGRGKGSQRRHKKDKAPTGSVVTDEEARQVEEEERKRTKEQEERRIDDLWSSFKQEAATRLVPPVAKEPSDCSKASTEPPLKTERGTVTVVKTYDFAGEEVRVPTEVAVDSKEGKRLLLEQPPEGLGPANVEQAAGHGGKGTSHSLGTKRSAGLSSVLAQISKKPKMTTLTKSKLDWNNYKKTQGLSEELAQGTKDGFLERKAFLERADWREYELEREERSKHFKRLM